jgi:dipeptidyl aminopeptidase/acylaminoacyl peptidase
VKQHAARSVCDRRPFVLALAIVIVVGLAMAWPAAQTQAKKVLTVDDYTRWRSITSQEMSGDGNWVAYGLQLANTAPTQTKPVLHLVNLTSGDDVEVQNGSGGRFSPDSHWVAYIVDPSGGRAGRGGRGAPGGSSQAGSEMLSAESEYASGGATPAVQGTQAGRGSAEKPTPPQRAELRNLVTGALRSWQNIESFAFSANSTHLYVRRQPATAAGRGAAGSEAASTPATGGAAAGVAESATGPRGVDVILHSLASGQDLLLGSVGDIAFNKAGDLLAYTVDAAVKDSNGLFVIDLAGGRVVPLDNAARSYSRLAWSEDGTALAVLKGADVEKMRERDDVLIAFSDVRAALAGKAAPVVFDPANADEFPRGWVVSDRAALSWSDDNKRVFFGMKEQVPAPDTSRRRSTDEAADVDVWTTKDERIQSVQMTRADQDRNFTFREAFDVSAAKFVRLADATMRELDVAPDGRWAVGRDTRGYIHDYKRTAADIYRVNTTTGERTLMLKSQMTNTSTGSHTFGISPDGRYFLYWRDNRFHAYDLDAGVSRPLYTTNSPGFADAEFDHPGPRPSCGIAGYTSDGKSVIVNQRYDVWLLPLDGSAGRNLTDGVGGKNEIRFRYVRTEPSDQQAGGPPGPGAPSGGRGGAAASRQTIDLTKPITLSAYGEWTKKAGFYELSDGKLREVVYEDASFSNPVKAAKADRFLFTRQTFVEFPDLRVSGPDFRDSRRISNVNPQQAEYRWGHRILFDFKNKSGVRLQGVLAIPDDYKPGEKRPMLVNFYEKNSQNMNRYPAPSYLTGMGSSPIQAVSEGYLTMLPDIYFRTGASHSDMLECVEAAVQAVIKMGYADPKRIGINGHSFGGEGAAFIGTRSRLFAAVAEGAGVTDLYNDFNQNWGWSYQVPGGNGGGANGSDYYLFQQQRAGVSPWDKPDMYHFESALTHVPEVTAPFLIMHGTADPTVSFTNSLGFYNALRYQGKTAYFLAYPGEGHGLRGMANRKDLTIRYFQFFNHYLKGEPAPKWMTDGVPFLEKDANRDPQASR